MKNPSILLNFRNRSVFALSALFLVIFLAIITSPVAMAFSQNNGDPYSNGTFFSDEGTFQTTVRGKNLSGVATFSTSGSNSTSTSSSNSTSSGSFSVSYQGFSYSGNVDASMDSADGSIAATMEASIPRGGAGTATETLSLTPSSTQIIPLPDQVTVVEVNNAGVITTTTTTQSGLSETVTVPGLEEIATSTYQDTLYTSGSFTAKLKNSFPNQILKGKGSMEFTSIDFSLAPPALGTTTVAISVKGSRTSNTAQSFTDQTVQAPFVLTTTTLNSL